MTIEIVNLAVSGIVVLTERMDTFTVGDVVAALPVMGAFQITDGRISAWRDYFDMSQITKMLSGASGRGQGRAHAIRMAEERADIIAIDICHDIDSNP